MIASLSASSRHEHLALYDPAGIPVETPLDPDLDAQDPKLPPRAALEELAASGAALFVRIRSEDCEATMRLQVDEALDVDVRQRGKTLLEGALLALPTGEARFDGAEFISRAGEHRTHSESESANVPPGKYSVHVLELLTWKLHNLPLAVRSRTTRFERGVDALVQAYTWLGILLFPGNLLVAPGIVGWVWAARGWQAAGVAVAVVLAIDALVLLGFWVLEWASKHVPVLSRVRDVRESIESENPDLIVSLRRETSERTATVPAYAELKVS